MASGGDSGRDRGPLYGFFSHLEELRNRLKVILYSALLAFLFFLLFSFRQVPLVGYSVWLPLPTFDLQQSISSQFFVAVKNWLLPDFVFPVVTNPWDAMIVQFKIAMFLALVGIAPIITYEFWGFVAPALKSSERRLIVRVSAPVVVLFILGILMSIVVVLPFTFTFLYSIAIAMGAAPFLQIGDFLDFVLLFTLAFGVAFELPVVMYGLSVLGIVSSDFWKKHWRIAVFGIFAFGAFITPDGSGVTMMLVSLPMLALYVAGYIAIRLRDRRLRRRPSSAKSS